MFAMLNYLRMHYFGEKGQGAVEYAVVVAAVVTVVLLVVGTSASGSLGNAITAAFTKVTNAIGN